MAWPRKQTLFGGYRRVIASGLVGSTDGYHESRRCSGDTYPESYITKYTSIRRQSSLLGPPLSDAARGAGRAGWWALELEISRQSTESSYSL